LIEQAAGSVGEAAKTGVSIAETAKNTQQDIENMQRNGEQNRASSAEEVNASINSKRMRDLSLLPNRQMDALLNRES